jgi:hypothetical protein
LSITILRQLSNNTKLVPLKFQKNLTVFTKCTVDGKKYPSGQVAIWGLSSASDFKGFNAILFIPVY